MTMEPPAEVRPRRRSRTAVVIGAIALVSVAASVMGADQAPAAGRKAPVDRGPCAAGYTRYDVRVYGQRLEEPDPRPGADHSRLTLTQNSWDDVATDHRYVVISACARPLTNDENMELFTWGSTHP